MSDKFISQEKGVNPPVFTAGDDFAFSIPAKVGEIRQREEWDRGFVCSSPFLPCENWAIFVLRFKYLYPKIMISVEGLTVEFGGFTLFDDITYVINKKDRIALVGKNGAGKSTMLKILAGVQTPTSGRVSLPKELTIGYLPQHMKHDNTRTVMEESELAFSKLFELQADIEKMTLELAEREDYESDSYHKLIDRVTHANELLSMMGAANYKADIEKTLIGLGFQRSDFDRLTSEFSGGWRMRIELAKLLMQQPDILLLDEPTNHLDIESIQWLEQFLATRANAVVLVSHDRAFLDNVTTRTIEISLGDIHDYKVSYSKYVVLREEGVLLPPNTVLETAAREAAVANFTETALANGILEQAQNNAEGELRRLLTLLGYRDIQFAK